MSTDLSLQLLLGNLALTATVVLCAQLGFWLLSIRLRDSSIADILWGPGFVLVALATYLNMGGDGVESRKLLVLLLTAVWGLRLGVYVYRRNTGHGEDPRYAAFRKKAPPGRENAFLLKHVFLRQGWSLWLTSIPVQVAQLYNAPMQLQWTACAGAALWLVGFAFEVIGDWQLARFKANPANAGKIMDRGLWRYTRHPNYFGDVCVWWGLFLIACDNWVGVFTIFAPLRMTNSLVNRTGKKLLEKRMSKRPGFAEYAARTSGFFPWPPKRG